MMLGGTARWGRAFWLATSCLLGACSQQPSEPLGRTTSSVALTPPLLHNNTAPIPGNGGLLIWTQFGTNMPSVDVRSMADPDAPIAGSMRALDRFWVWTADATMPEGSYTVVTSDSVGIHTEVIEVTAPRAFGKPELMSTPSLTVDMSLETYACCYDVIDHTRVDQACFATATKDYVNLSPGVTTPELGPALTQLLFEVEAADGIWLVGPELFGGGLEPLTFDVYAEEYCFELTVTEIATGEQYTFPDLDNCAVLGDAPGFGTRTRDPADSDLDRLVCPAPPDGYEAIWCAVNEAGCAAAPTSMACRFFGHVCRGEPLPEPMTTGGSGGAAGVFVSMAGAGGTGGAGGASGMASHNDPTAASGAGGAGADEEAAEPAKHVTACSARPGSRALGLWPLLALLGVALALRVSRSS